MSIRLIKNSAVMFTTFAIPYPAEKLGLVKTDIGMKGSLL
jgi:hypothetical protein